MYLAGQLSSTGAACVFDGPILVDWSPLALVTGQILVEIWDGVTLIMCANFLNWATADISISRPDFFEIWFADLFSAKCAASVDNRRKSMC